MAWANCAVQINMALGSLGVSVSLLSGTFDFGIGRGMVWLLRAALTRIRNAIAKEAAEAAESAIDDAVAGELEIATGEEIAEFGEMVASITSEAMADGLAALGWGDILETVAEAAIL